MSRSPLEFLHNNSDETVYLADHLQGLRTTEFLQEVALTIRMCSTYTSGANNKHL